MSTIDHHRAAYQDLSHIHLGSKKPPKRIASLTESAQIKKALMCLREAETSTSESAFNYNVSSAFRILRNLCNARFK